MFRVNFIKVHFWQFKSVNALLAVVHCCVNINSWLCWLILMPNFSCEDFVISSCVIFFKASFQMSFKKIYFKLSVKLSPSILMIIAFYTLLCKWCSLHKHNYYTKINLPRKAILKVMNSPVFFRWRNQIFP